MSVHSFDILCRELKLPINVDFEKALVRPLADLLQSRGLWGEEVQRVRVLLTEEAVKLTDELSADESGQPCDREPSGGVVA